MRVPWLLFAIVLGVAATSLAEAGVAVDLKTPWLRRSMRTTTICARSKRNLPRCIAARAWSGPRPARYGSKKPARCDGSTVLPRSRLSAMVKVCVVLRPGGPAGTKTAAKKLEDVRSPLAFLLGKTKLEKELQGLSLAPDVEPRQPANAIGSDCLLTTFAITTTAALPWGLRKQTPGSRVCSAARGRLVSHARFGGWHQRYDQAA